MHGSPGKFDLLKTQPALKAAAFKNSMRRAGRCCGAALPRHTATPRKSPVRAVRYAADRVGMVCNSRRVCGRGGRTRTDDLVVPNDARYQTAPHPVRRIIT